MIFDNNISINDKNHHDDAVEVNYDSDIGCYHPLPNHHSHIIEHPTQLHNEDRNITTSTSKTYHHSNGDDHYHENDYHIHHQHHINKNNNNHNDHNIAPNSNHSGFFI